MKSVHKAASSTLALAAAAMLAGCASSDNMADKQAMAKDGAMTKEAMAKDAMAEQKMAMLGKCHGVNSCQGHSDCATANSSCKGQNSCKGQGWVQLNKKECGDKGGEFESV